MPVKTRSFKVESAPGLLSIMLSVTAKRMQAVTFERKVESGKL